MTATFPLILDTTGPQAVGGAINGGAAKTNTRAVTLAATTNDPDTTGYMVKVWGADVDLTADPNIQGTEAASSWFMLTPAIAVNLTAGDGVKTLNWRLRDDVLNTSAAASDQIELDTVAPVITISAGPDVSKVSKIATKDTASVTWSSDSHLQAWEVRVVPSPFSDHTAGTVIANANGSTNVSGGALNAATAVTTQIKGADLEVASAGDGSKQIKIFGQDDAGNWSI